MHRIYLLLHIHVYIYPHHRDSFAHVTHLLSFQHSSPAAFWGYVEILIRQDFVCPIRPTINENSHDRPSIHTLKPQTPHETRDNGVVQDPCPPSSPIVQFRQPIIDDYSEPQLPCLHRPSITDNLKTDRQGRSTIGRSRRHGAPPYLQLNLPHIHPHTRAARGI
jgi:hypothetical protein